MRSMLVLTAATVALLSGVSFASPAAAGGDLKVKAPEGHAQERDVHHWVYYPRYRHFYHVADPTQRDPYQWQYSPRGYYPYHASQYWVPAEDMRYRYRYRFSGPKYKYQQAWGYQKPHAPKDDGHGFWHW